MEQLYVLEKENKNRFGDNTFNDLIDSMNLFFNTTFIEKSNEKDIAYFEEKLYAGIEEIKNALQNMENDIHLEISNVLNPKYRPNIHMYLYEFANLCSCIFTKNRKLYMKETLIKPLKDYIKFVGIGDNECNALNTFYCKYKDAEYLNEPTTVLSVINYDVFKTTKSDNSQIIAVITKLDNQEFYETCIEFSKHHKNTSECAVILI